METNTVAHDQQRSQAGNLAFLQDLIRANRARFPQQIINAKRWLLWKAVPVPRYPEAKPDKVPYYINGYRRHGEIDSPAEIARLGTFDEAVNAYVNDGGEYEGLAFALGPDGNGGCWQGIDLDDVSKNQLSDLANALPSYVEMSPSGNGVHAIGYGHNFQSLGSNKTGIEAYAGKRFFTWTGDTIRGADTPLHCLADIVQRVLAPRHRATSLATVGSSTLPIWVAAQVVTELRQALASMRSDEYELWIRMGHALHELGDKGRALWIEWSQFSDKWKPEDAKRWDGFKPTNTGYAAVFAEAQRRGWLNPNSNEARGTTKKASTRDANGAADEFALPVPELRPEALYGILGEIAAAGSAHTEAVPATLAINTLARFCAVVGRDPYITIGDDYRSLRLFVLIIGPTGVGRKGTSAQLPERIFRGVEECLRSWRPSLLPLRYETAVSSGEGLVWMTRDPIVKGDELIDEGVADKRVLLEISEFAGTLAQMKRETSTLTAVLRDAFDGRRLATPNKNNPCFATGAHFVTIGHITREELTALLSTTDVMNGFANRFMMVYSARNKRVHEPQPTQPEVVNNFAHRIAHAVKLGMERGAQPIPRSEEARQWWIELSDELEQRARPANIAKLMARDRLLLGAVRRYCSHQLRACR